MRNPATRHAPEMMMPIGITRRSFFAAAAAVAATTSIAAKPIMAETPLESDDVTPYMLFFAQPAVTWADSLPVGNGRLGACIFGNPHHERIQLNEESIWDGDPGRDRRNPKAKAAIPRIRQLLFDGKIAEAEALATSDMLSIPRRLPCYQTLGDLYLDFAPSGISAGSVPPVTDYRLELNLDTAIVTTSFTQNNTRFKREVFASARDQVIVVRLTADRPGSLSFTVRFDRPGNSHLTSGSPNRLALSGQALPVNDNPDSSEKERQTGVKFRAELFLVRDGGSVTQTRSSSEMAKSGSNVGSALLVTSANSVTLLIDCSTSYRYPAARKSLDALIEGDPAAMSRAVRDHLTTASHRSYSELRARHISDHRMYFRRADISLLGKNEQDEKAQTPTDRRVLALKEGDEDVHLLPIYFQYGRYLLIASSRPGTLAANLQGIWNESLDPPWGCKYTININTQMNYWLADRANLSAMFSPLVDLVQMTRNRGALVATGYYGARGYVSHHNTDLWGNSVPIDGLGGGIWPMGAAWLSLQLWDHFEYTCDPQFLRQRVYPALHDNALFLLDYLTPAPAGTPHAGYLTTGPSCSPENIYRLPGDHLVHNLCMGPTMDIEISRAVFTRFLQAGQMIHDGKSVDSGLLTHVKEALAKLPPFQITHDGRLQEWDSDYAEAEPGHRHISHLFALFPDDQITLRRTPDLARACRQTLDKRLAAGGGSTGWSRAWIINCMARLEDGDACYDSILKLLGQSTRGNLFDLCGITENRPFQIDGNLGGSAGIVEMLLQSHSNGGNHRALANERYPSGSARSKNIIRLLPALPEAWPNGSFRGLVARGGVELDLTWEGGRATVATLRSNSGGTHILAPPRGQLVTSVVRNGKPFPFEATDAGMVQLQSVAGSSLTIRFS